MEKDWIEAQAERNSFLMYLWELAVSEQARTGDKKFIINLLFDAVCHLHEHCHDIEHVHEYDCYFQKVIWPQILDRAPLPGKSEESYQLQTQFIYFLSLHLAGTALPPVVCAEISKETKFDSPN